MLSCKACNGVICCWETYCPRCGSPVIANSLNLPDTLLIAGEVVMVIQWRTIYGIPLGYVVRREVVREPA